MMIHFLTFGSNNYDGTLKRISEEAKNSNFFDTINIYGENNLTEDLKKYCDENSRGYGFWSWKPYVIHEQLKKSEYGDILVYCDAGCTLNSNGKPRYDQYIYAISQEDYDMMVFETSIPEKEYQKSDTIRFFNAQSLMNTGQIIATCIIIKKTDNSIKIIEEWKNICFEHKNLIDDSPQTNPEENPYFKDNRHDQSIFSLVIKKNQKILKVFDETFRVINFENNIFEPQFPFWGSRLRY